MKRYLLSAFAVLGFVSGCSSEEGGVSCSGSVDLSCVIQDAGAFTAGNASGRTSMTGSVASFTANDRIGVFETLTGRMNNSFTYNGSSWQPASQMYWYDMASVHTFYSYYPFSAANQGSVVTVPNLSGQLFRNTPDPSCDMLVAGPKAQARSAGTTVALTFTHAFSLLQFNITAPLVNTYTMKTMTVSGGNPAGGANPYGIFNTTADITKVGYSLTAKLLQLTVNDGSVFTQGITQDISSVGIIGAVAVTVYVLVLPGTYASPAPNIQFLVSTLLGGNQNTKVAALPNTQFAPGTKYTYSVRVGGVIVRSPEDTEACGKEAPELTCILTGESPVY